MIQKGSLVSFEGGEGAGKTTQVKLLAERLREHGKEVVVCREPGGTEIAEQIRQVVLSTHNRGMDERAELMLFMAARAQLFAEIVKPALSEGKIVLADRSRDSSVVYQGVRGLEAEFIETLNDLVMENVKPEVTFLLDVPVEVGLKRYLDINRFEREDGGFHEKVRQAYLRLAEKEPERWVVIDGTKSIEVVAEEVWGEVRKRMKLRAS
ncbi:MAG: dTMP kinase [Candidatus Chisholmbacteria bacterium]|nr:dTMP kinase [Candidatus Chisholmbacteria bacterium]